LAIQDKRRKKDYFLSKSKSISVKEKQYLMHLGNISPLFAGLFPPSNILRVPDFVFE
jgi:hypothetical protein